MPIFTSRKTVTGLQYDIRGSNLRSHIRWMTYLASDKLEVDVVQRVGNGRNRNEILRSVRKVIQEEVYDVYEPVSYQRTRKLYKSFKCEREKSDLDVPFVIYSDTSIAEAKTLDGFSYAAFFLSPNRFNSFIPPRRRLSIERYRPYLKHLENIARIHLETKTLEAYEYFMEARKPKEVAV
jgi:hypothetical protein